MTLSGEGNTITSDDVAKVSLLGKTIGNAAFRFPQARFWITSE
jgi:hypothetical protein